MAMSYSPQTDALMQRLRPVGAAPVDPTAAASPFARGGQVKQLPGNGTAGKLGDVAGSVGVQLAGKQLGQSAAQAAAGGAAQSGLKSALTSGAGGAAAGMGIGIGTGLLANKLRTKEEMPTFGGANGAILDDYGRRFQGTGGGINSNAVKYAGMVANPALTASTMGLNLAAGAAFGAIKGAVTKHAKSAYTDFRVEDGADAIKKAYQADLGRDASDEEVQAQLVGQGWDPKGGDRWVGEKGINSVLDGIRNSPEAAAFKAGGAAPQAGAGAAPADPLGRGGSDPFSTGTQALRAQLATPALESRGLPGTVPDSINPDGSGGMTGRGGGIQPAADGAPAAAAPDSSGWDTDGYAAPAYVPQAAGAAPPGWDADKWNDPTHQTPKYGVGRILSTFPATVDGLTAAMPDIQKAYPGATFDGKDKVTLPGVGTIDVLKAAGKGGEGWQWDDGSGGDSAGPMESGANSSTGAMDLGQGGGNQGDVLAAIQQLIAREGQSSSGGLTQALMNQLRQTA